VLEPILSAFDPQLVIIAAGFDAVEGDPLGGCHVTPRGFGHLAARLLRLAGGRAAAVLEGGYECA
jgi:histone deacetylase 6